MTESKFYDRLDEQTSSEYGKRIKIDTDLNKHRFELIYRETEDDEAHRTVTCFDERGKVANRQSERQQISGEFNKENIESQFDHFISEEWHNYK